MSKHVSPDPEEPTAVESAAGKPEEGTMTSADEAQESALETPKSEFSPENVMHLAESEPVTEEPREAADAAEEPGSEPAPEVVRSSDELEAPAAESLGAEATADTADVQDIPAATETPETVTPVAVAQAVEVTETADDAAADPEPAVNAEPAPRAAEAAVVASSFAAKTFDFLALLGPVAVLLFLLLQSLPGLGLRSLWTPGMEQAIMNGFTGLRAAADPFAFTVDGTWFPALPPAYFWFLAGIERLWLLTPVPMDMPLLLLGGTVISGILLMLFTWIMARVCLGNRREAFAACAVLLTTVSVCMIGRFATPDLLFAACTVLSCLFMYVGFVNTIAPVSLLFGFVLAGAAVIVNGIMGLILPLGASFLFLMWRGTFRRAGAWDGAFAFFILLAGLGGWLAWLGLSYGRAPLEALAELARAQWSLDLLSTPQLWLCAGITAAVLLLPWTLLVLFLPWERMYRIPVALWRCRNQAPGVGFVWCVVLVGLACMLVSGNPMTVFVIVVPCLAMLIGRAVVRMSAGRSRLFFGLLGIILFVLAVVLGLGALLPLVSSWVPADLAALVADYVAIATLPGMIFVAAAALLFSFVLLKCTDKRYPCGGLLVLLLFVTAAMAPINLLTLPVMQPQTMQVKPVAPAEKSAAPAEKAVAPAEKPAETPAPAQTPAPAETPTPAEKPAETPSAPAEKPAEAPAPVDAAPPAETPAAQPAAPVENSAAPAPAAETPEAPASPAAPEAPAAPASPAAPEAPANPV